MMTPRQAIVLPLALARRTPLTTREFDRWVSLFQATVDDLFTGSIADQAKRAPRESP